MGRRSRHGNAEDEPVSPAQPAIHAPWRQEYLDTVDKAGIPKPAGKPDTGSFLRDYWLSPEDDESNHVVARTPHGLILLNRYPYAGGHLLVTLAEARPRLLDYSAQQRQQLWELVHAATALMERTLEPQGINLGINQGRAAGAGVPQHLHVHLVPRWGGDVNFMAVVSNVRVIPSSLEAMAARYRKVWREMQAGTTTGQSPNHPS
jgi:ATP adenylyltransferase